MPIVPSKTARLPSYRAPRSLGAAVDLLCARRDERLAFERVAEEMKRREGELEREVLARLRDARVDAATGKTGAVRRGRREFALVEDWAAFYAFIHKHKAYELLQRRPALDALKERLEAGTPVAGARVEAAERLTYGKAKTR
jgi:hypothetical protein